MAQARSRARTEEGRDENVTANKGQAFMGLAVVLGLAAAVVGYFGLSAVSTQARRTTMGETQDVVVTSGDVTYGEKLEKSMLRTVRYPRESVPAGAFSTVDSVVGQTTKIFMTAKEPVTAIKLSSLGGGLSMLVRPGMRAASVEVNQVSGVSGFILPGDRVDMLVTVENVLNPEDAYTQTILQDVEVLAAGMKTTTQDNKPLAVQAVTLLVDPKDAEYQLKMIEAIVNSMTRQERQDPDVLNASRRRRIARGSGTDVQDVNRLMKQFRETQRMMKTLQKSGGRGLPHLFG